ncbi:MAG: hypothetical protein EBS09_11705, partial [Flavobacteriia bacterium]|nr:hypothetical protein [Flavobacteriia bacterium]
MVSLLEEGLRSDDSDEYQTPSEEVTKIHHDVFIFYFFFSAPFDAPPSAGGREEMVSLLEEGLR